MDTVIIACKTLEDELRIAQNKTGADYPVLWIESGLHNTPKKLNTRLREHLCSVKQMRVLLVMGFCGNAIQDIEVDCFELIVPRVDDCISLLLGSIKERLSVSNEYAAYFLTDGWLRGERNLWVEYLYARDKYGEEEAKSIAKMMFGHYRTLCLLDSGAAPIDALIENSREIAETMNLEQKVIPATISYIEELLTGPWTQERFVIKRSGEKITLNDLAL